METMQAPAVPGFAIGRLLGSGGTAHVWEAVRLTDGRSVALKVSHGDPEAAEAAVREAAVSSRAAAEHIVRVEACLTLPDDRVALVMPLMRGGSLAGLVGARGHLGPGEVVTVLAPLAGALGRLHAAGVVHGDVSPGNVLLDLDGRPALADLGLGRVLGEAPAAVWGTPGHLAPEVLLGADPTPAADVYALGALGWLCLAGEVPGAPGLRPSLTQVSRAGAGSEAVVAALEAAVHPRPEERPGADELACLLFAAARPEPLRLRVAGDDGSAVTYRLRAAAGRPPVPPAPERGRHRAPTPGTTDRRGVARPVALGVCALGLVAALVVVGALVGREDPARASVPSAAPSAGPSATDDPRLDPLAPVRRPQDLLTVLADERAAAYRAADPTRLDAAETRGGALHRRDAAAVATLRAAGARYDGLAYRVTDVVVRSADVDRATLRATVAVGAHRVVRPGDDTDVTAVPGEPVLVDVVRTAEGWRVEALRSP
ncbi:serine/threonine protein kinase [Phycicoccus sp. MAQZ13P-2]|uniref:protein kinase domain-containing protein n=1 Tax=Phycicoccus mangrovi TaxID=2840470 RepID=UPI001C005989|nr:serine/threonine-protein kinase [Phycicoccus mangrovi]MBT9254789.1 serine/threonine protein kinase [Phycicoccus mangrovi]MBT9273006.1 serine/threonine protein kinase [Phycicoccus mangrovi]